MLYFHFIHYQCINCSYKGFAWVNLSLKFTIFIACFWWRYRVCSLLFKSAGATEAMPPLPAPLTFLVSKKEKTADWKIIKKHKIVKRSHHSTYSSSRGNYRTLICGGKNRSSITAYSKQTNCLCQSQQQTLPQSSKIYQSKSRMVNAWCALY